MNARILISILLAATLQAGETVETELAQLQRAMKSAASQQAMNDASGELAKYWDRMLEKEEAKILASCDAEREMLFRAAQKSWREFRLAETILNGNEYRGGSIQLLIHNSVFASLTEQRVKELRAMSEQK